MKLQRIMPLRYWLMLALILGSSIFSHISFGYPFRMPTVALIIVAILGFLAREDGPAGS